MHTGEPDGDSPVSTISFGGWQPWPCHFPLPSVPVATQESIRQSSDDSGDIAGSKARRPRTVRAQHLVEEKARQMKRGTAGGITKHRVARSFAPPWKRQQREGATIEERAPSFSLLTCSQCPGADDTGTKSARLAGWGVREHAQSSTSE